MSDPIQAAVDAERERALAQMRTAPRSTPSRADQVRAFEQLRDDMAAGLAFRLGEVEPERDAAFPFVAWNFARMVSTLLGFRGASWSSTREMYARGIGSGDVAALLTGAGNRVMQRAFESYSGGLLRYCQRVETRDFRDLRSIQLDGDLALLEVKDGDVFANGSLKANAETYPVASFGRIFTLTRNLVADDDLAAFGNLTAQLGRQAAEFTAGKVVAVLESTAVLSDGVAPFATVHANLGTAGALSETTLGQLLALMRGQTGLGGERISAVPKALVVPPALEVTAAKLLTTVFGSSAPVEVTVEPRLSSATAFYVLADPASLSAISYTLPGGAVGPTIELGRKAGFEGLQAKTVLDFGCGWSDYRGAAKNAGA